MCSGVFTLLAIGSAAAVSVAWLVCCRIFTPATDEWVARVVVLALLLAPAAVLLLFVAGLRDLARLPERTRALPADLRDRARDLREPLRGSQRRRVLGVVASLIRLGRVVLGSRDALVAVHGRRRRPAPGDPDRVALRRSRRRRRGPGRGAPLS